jgi:hypothetical protein
MPPQNRLAPTPNNSLAYSVPVPFDAGMLPPPPTQFVPRRELENLSIGLGRGFVSGLEGTKQMVTQPVVTAKALLEAARQISADPRIVLDMLREARQRAASGALGLGELIGENVTPGMRGRAAPNVRKIFVGKGSKTWDAAAAKRAEELEAAGESPERIWQQTGTFRSPDGQLRQEISDLPATWQNQKSEGRMDYHLEHPALYEAYPDIGTVWTTPTAGAKGSYQYAKGGYPEEFISVGTDNPRSIALHELQHAVQKREGFGRGGNKMMAFKDPAAWSILSRMRANMRTPMSLQEYAEQAWQTSDITKEIRSDYRKYVKSVKQNAEKLDVEAQKQAAAEYYTYLAGEAEARAVQERAGYTPAMRQQRLPTLDYDVPINELIVRKYD